MKFLRRLKPFIWNPELLSKLQCEKITTSSRCYCTQKSSPSKDAGQDRDPFLTFMRSDVQLLLTRLTGFDEEKTFQAFKAKTASKPKFKMLTDEELQAEHDELLKHHGWKRLQMPPFMAERKPRDEIISDDVDIGPTIKSKYVFVDISWKNKRIMGHNSRPIVCRHPDGKLKWADWDQVDRMNQMFDPVEGRMLMMPKMFEPKILEELLEIDHPEYRYILERACIQFEPDSDDFIRVTRRIYEEISKRRKFEDLYATRFYGPMAFYYCWVKTVGPLLSYLLENERVVNAALLVKLYEIVDPEFKLKSSSSAKSIIQQFAAYAKKNSLPEWETLDTQAEAIQLKSREAKAE